MRRPAAGGGVGLTGTATAPVRAGRAGPLRSVGALKSGWMMKQGGSVKTWKRRFFVLKGLALAYYETEYDTTPKGTTAGRACPSALH